MKTVLLLSTYPFKVPRHGGQVRIANIAKTYENAGWYVISIAIYEPEAYSVDVAADGDIQFPRYSEFRKFRGRSIPLITDLLTGYYAADESGAYNNILKKIPQRIDVIHTEQPWLWPLVEKLKKEPSHSSAITIYGSQNIEAPLKREILESYCADDVSDVITEIELLEKRAATRANIVLAVTSADQIEMEAWGAQNVVLAPNGIAPWSADIDRLDHWKKILPKAPWILYVASAHPPNFTGFNECLGNSLACIPPDSRLVVAGSVGEHLANALANSKWSSMNLSRVQLLYVLNDEDLSAVKTLAHAFLLPIPHGGGSNIKTAEAIYSGKFVVGTEPAFRGFERFTNLPEVTVAKSPSDFHSAIRNVLTIDAPIISTADQEARRSLTWEICLSVIISSIFKLNAGTHSL